MPNCTPDEASATLLARREDQIGPASKQSDVDITRASHYVPQATLRRWSANGTHLYAYRILVSHPGVPEWRLHGIRGLVRQADLYTTFDGSTEGDDFERFIIREIEEPGQEAIEQLLAKGRMRPADWTESRCLSPPNSFVHRCFSLSG